MEDEHFSYSATALLQVNQYFSYRYQGTASVINQRDKKINKIIMQYLTYFVVFRDVWPKLHPDARTYATAAIVCYFRKGLGTLACHFIIAVKR